MSDLTIRTAKAPTVAEFLRPSALVGLFEQHRGLIAQFASRDVLERHKGAYLGVAWNVASPLVALAIYTFVFGFVFESRWAEATPGHDAGGGGGHAGSGAGRIAGFVLPFFLGHALFHFFSESTNRAPSAVSSRPNLVKKVLFPVEILPVVGVLAAMVYPLVCLVGLLIVQLVINGRVPATVVLLPLCILPLVPLCLGVSWLLSAVGSYVRDIRYVVPVLTQLAMFLTPVFYSIDRIPESWRWIFAINPLSIVIENSRAVMLWGRPPDWRELAILSVASLVFMQVGYALFMRLRRGLADVI